MRLSRILYLNKKIIFSGYKKLLNYTPSLQCFKTLKRKLNLAMKMEFDGNLSLFLPLMFCFEGEPQNHLKHSSECDIVSKSHQKKRNFFHFHSNPVR
jgi:hypothetical protein